MHIKINFYLFVNTIKHGTVEEKVFLQKLTGEIDLSGLVLQERTRLENEYKTLDTESDSVFAAFKTLQKNNPSSQESMLLASQMISLHEKMKDIKGDLELIDKYTWN